MNEMSFHEEVINENGISRPLEFQGVGWLDFHPATIGRVREFNGKDSPNKLPNSRDCVAIFSLRRRASENIVGLPCRSFMESVLRHRFDFAQAGMDDALDAVGVEGIRAVSSQRLQSKNSFDVHDALF